MANRRDKLQLQMIGRSIFPGQTGDFIRIYQQALLDNQTYNNNNYGYLVVDLMPESDSAFQLRTGILSGCDWSTSP